MTAHAALEEAVGTWQDFGADGGAVPLVTLRALRYLAIADLQATLKVRAKERPRAPPFCRSDVVPPLRGKSGQRTVPQTETWKAQSDVIERMRAASDVVVHHAKPMASVIMPQMNDLEARLRCRRS